MIKHPGLLFASTSILSLALAACSSSSSTAGPGSDGGAGNDTGGGSDSPSMTDSKGGGPEGSAEAGPPSEGGPGSSSIKTIFLILMENHNWSSILGSASAPYINGLLAMGASCDQYFDNPKMAHPSEPNYLWLEAGDNFGILDDADPAQNHQSTTDHLVTQLQKVGVTWHAYQEDMMAGTCPITGVAKYAPKHNPMVFFDDIVGSPPSATSAPCLANEFPYTQFAADLTANTVAKYNFITPNLCNDMHDSCAPTNDPIAQGDTWLMNEVPKIMASQAYMNGGAIFITWDESEGGEFPIGMIVLSPLAKPGGYIGHTKYYHSSMLRTVEEVMGVPLLRDAANQPSLSDLFTKYP